jgi:hypothetical protein
VQYKALLRRRDGSIAEILPYGVDRITGNAVSLNLGKAKFPFPPVADNLESPSGPIQLLVGMDHMEEAPKEEARAQGVALYSSQIGTGYVTGGDMTPPQGQEFTPVRDDILQPARVHTRGGHGYRTPTQVPRVPKLQRVPVPHGQPDLQGEH